MSKHDTQKLHTTLLGPAPINQISIVTEVHRKKSHTQQEALRQKELLHL